MKNTKNKEKEIILSVVALPQVNNDGWPILEVKENNKLKYRGHHYIAKYYETK